MNNTDCIIPLSQGQFAIVSQEDYEFVSQFKWCAEKRRTSYGYRWYARRVSKKKHINLHRVIAKRAGLPESREYDHKDRNGLNNTRDNVRPCTRSQNMANRTKAIGLSSKYKGVNWRKERGMWQARIQINGKRIALGHFINELDAHLAYATAAAKYFGEFACP